MEEGNQKEKNDQRHDLGICTDFIFRRFNLKEIQLYSLRYIKEEKSGDVSILLHFLIHVVGRIEISMLFHSGFFVLTVN